MTLEDHLHNIGPALDRAIDEAADGVSHPAMSPPARASGSRSRVATAALVAAAVVAAVVGLVSLLGSVGENGGGIKTRDTSAVSSSTVSSTTTSTTTASSSTTAAASTTTTPAGAALQSVQWSSVDYPIGPHCAGLNPPVSVLHVAYAVPAPGVQLAAVLVRCNVGAGTPPAALYVYDSATSTRSPHLSAALVTAGDGWQAGDFNGANPLRVTGASISLAVAGFSSSSLPNCCPDVRATLVWHWTGSRYQLSSSIPPHVRNSAFG
jgi:hypothetical protein